MLRVYIATTYESKNSLLANSFSIAVVILLQRNSYVAIVCIFIRIVFISL